MQNNTTQETIGFIGQGWIGKHYADEMENRGVSVIRYALEEPYNKNKDAIKDASIVFIAVPTMTTPEGFDGSVVRDAIALTAENAIVVIKSTIVLGTTAAFQEKFPARFIMHSPEFLTRNRVLEDVSKPIHNILGIPRDTQEFKDAAQRVLAVLPKSDSEVVISAEEAEIFKYARNCFLYTKNVFFNLIHDLVEASGGSYEHLQPLMEKDPWIGGVHTKIVDRGGRGAGGPCLIKDFAALKRVYDEKLPNDATGRAVLKALEEKNVTLLTESQKDIDLLEGVYGGEK